MPAYSADSPAESLWWRSGTPGILIFAHGTDWDGSEERAGAPARSVWVLSLLPRSISGFVANSNRFLGFACRTHFPPPEVMVEIQQETFPEFSSLESSVAPLSDAVHRSIYGKQVVGPSNLEKIQMKSRILLCPVLSLLIGFCANGMSTAETAIAANSQAGNSFVPSRVVERVDDTRVVRLPGNIHPLAPAV